MKKIDWKQPGEGRLPKLPKEFSEGVEIFYKLMTVYQCAIREVNTKLENLNSELEIWGDRNPIQYMSHRIKSPQSILEKINRMGLPVEAKTIWNNISDIAGMRVVCSYLEDIYDIAEMLIKQDDVFLLEWKDYIEHPKPSGYRSLHLIIETPVFFSNEKHMVRVEVQIRTIAMDFWASLEHQLRYKTEVDIPETIRKDLNRIAEDIYQRDLEMQVINKKIQKIADFHKSMQ